MKKILAFISCLLIASAAVFADVSVKKLDNGQIEVTFFYGNPRATEVLLAGDFTNWQDGAEPMTKGDKGFTLVKVVPAGTVMKYKFISDGNWTEDLKEPDKVDDGFGGHNGLVDVDYLIAAAAGGGAPKPKTGLKFGTWSMVGLQTKFALQNDEAQEVNAGVENAGIGARSYLKLSGNALPNMPAYFEIALFEMDNFDNLYSQGEVDILSGLKNFAADLVFDPVYYFDGQKAAKTYLGHLKFGLESPYVNWWTGYKYAKLPPHNINSWCTVDQEWEAGYAEVGGYNYFELGQELRQIGDFKINAAIAPNRSADRKGNQYGLFTWLDFDMNDFGKIGVQYNGAYGYTFDTIFGHSYEHDIIAGYNLNLGNPKEWGTLALNVNGVYNIYGDGKLTKLDGVTYMSKYIPAASDVGEVDSSLSGLDNAAANINLTFNTSSDADLPIYLQVGARFRGRQASMMYVEEGADDHTNISNQLGKRNHWRAWIDFNTKVNYETILLGVKPYIQMTLNPELESPFGKASDDAEKKALASNILVDVKPYFVIDFDEWMFFPATLTGYAEVKLSTQEAAYFKHGTDADGVSHYKQMFDVPAGSLVYTQKFDKDSAFKKFEVVYAFDNTDENYMWNTLTAVLDTSMGWKFQTGAGLRTLWEGGKASSTPTSPFGVFVGALTKLPILQKPVFYMQGMYGMDPYNKFTDGPTAFRLSPDYDNLFKDGVSDYAHSAAIRCGLQWDL